MGSNLLSLPNSSSTSRWKYDVFLSFRGEDTRYKFTDHLYTALKERGIVTFRDDENLERGKVISPELLKAIEESRFAVVILSENYASSTWCLDELAKIIDCNKALGMKVLPVFHYVDPSHVRKQKGPFEEDFVAHEECFKEKIEKVHKWRDALRQVGELAGWHLKNGSESQTIQSIVGLISRSLSYEFIELTEDFVGIKTRVVELESIIAVGLDDVRFIGVWAMGGMGKTTLASVVYRLISEEFEASFFVNVREDCEKDGLLSLQKKLLCQILKETNLNIDNINQGAVMIRNRLRYRRILVVLDDVDRLEQLKMLARKPSWFGPGSRIIITTRNKNLLDTHLVDKIFEVKPLNDDYAHRLFCLNAFKKKYVPDEYLELSKEILNHVDGLPLALEVFGSFLFGKSIVEWKSAFERLKEDPGRDISQVLQISFDGLRHSEKEIFLHIACFFNHEEENDVVEILESVGLFPEIGMRELIDKSLLKIYDNKLWMHDLLVGMGRYIVHQESPNEPGKRSRLWLYKDIDYVLKYNMGSEAVQAMDIRGAIDTRGIYHDKREGCWRLRGSALLVTNVRGKEAVWDPDAFLKMPNLKFLRIHNTFPRHVPKHLPNNLRFIEWSDYPSKSLPYQLDEIVQLSLQQSKIELIWEGVKNFDKLKVIDLAGSSDLIMSPDFTGVPNLKELVLARCSNLRQLHPSIGNLKKLILLDLEGCKELSCLPNKFEMDSLEVLDLSYCLKVEKVPEFGGDMKCLEALLLECTAITELPTSVECLTGLNILILEACKNLQSLPNTICSLTLIDNLNLSKCSKFDKLPESLGDIVSLKELSLSGTAIKELPSSIESLIGLQSLNLNDCKNFVFLPSSICNLKSLSQIDLCGCSKFVNLPDNLGNLEGLGMLFLEGTAIEMLPSSIGSLTALWSLKLRGCKNLKCLPNTICNLKKLDHLDLFGCSKIVNLPKDLGKMERLEFLQLSCTSIKRLPFSTMFLKRLSAVYFGRCNWPSFSFDLMPMLLRCCIRVNNLVLNDCHLLAIPNNIGCLLNLNQLNLSGNDFVSLPESISHLSNLRRLYLDDCKRLRSLPNLPSEVDYISVNNCTSLERLPGPKNNIFRPGRFSLLFKCINCFKLADNIQSGFDMLQGQSGKLLARRLPSIIPGSEIPSWLKEVQICEEPFSVSFDSSLRCMSHLLQNPNRIRILKIKKVNIQVPFNGCEKWAGILLCLVFVPRERHRYPSQIDVFSMEVDGRPDALPDELLSKHGICETYCKFESHHLWLVYLPQHRYPKSPGGSIDANGFHEVEIKIATVGMAVEKIGFGLVYGEEFLEGTSNRSVEKGFRQEYLLL